MLKYDTKRDKHPIADRNSETPFHASTVPTVDDVDEVITQRTTKLIIQQVMSDRRKGSQND